MNDARVTTVPEGLDRLPPTQDELPYDDGMPMESHQHVLQMTLLMETLRRYWAGRRDVFIGGNMFVYFSPDQVRKYDFRGPDVFVALDVQPRERKSWLVWEEGKAPDVVIELLSDSTAARDRGEKKQIYQDRLRVPEYYWYHPFTGELAGFALRDGVYEPIVPDDQGRLHSRTLDLLLVPWHGTYAELDWHWLRWATPDGALLDTPDEAAAAERARTEQERRRAQQEHQRAVEMEALLARYRERFGELPD